MTPILHAASLARAATVDEVSNGGDVLVLAPHPDDESLGCGGAIAALTDLGRGAQVIVVTDGGMSHPASRSHPPTALARLRAAEVTTAVDLLTEGRGPAPVLLGYPDRDAPEGKAVAGALARIAPHILPGTAAIWATWGGDPHVDHQRTAHLAAMLAAEHPALALWSYPIWGRFEPQVAAFDPAAMVQVDTAAWQGRKAAAIAAHVSQMSGLIADDPDGFRMTAEHQRHFLTSPEIFLRETPR